MKFYNRFKELEAISRILSNPRANLVVIYGQRRIGKTTLVRKAFEEKENVFYYSVDVVNEEKLIEKISLSFSKAVYRDWFDLFLDIFKQYKYVIFDEFQNFYKVSPGILYSFQRAWDEAIINGLDVKVFALGSYVGLMKRLFYDEKHPLFGRKDYVLNVGEFSFSSFAKVMNDVGYDPKSIIEIFGIIGGIPNYFKYFEQKGEVLENVYQLFLEPYAPLKNDVETILVLEFGREHRGYFSLLEALGQGPKSISELSDLSKMEPTTISKYLIELEDEYDFVESFKPVGTKKQKNTKYKLKNNFFDFYFSVVKPILPIIEFAPEKARELLKEKISQYLGIKFEETCLKFIFENPDVLGFTPAEIGKYWGKVPGRKSESFDVDIVAFDEKNLLLGECKWTNKEVGIGEYHKLIEKSSMLEVKRDSVKYMLLSKSGFTPELLRMKSEKLILLTPEEIVKTALENKIR